MQKLDEDVRIIGFVVGGSIGKRLMGAMMGEYERNGRKMLSPGKIRYLRRLIRRDAPICDRYISVNIDDRRYRSAEGVIDPILK